MKHVLAVEIGTTHLRGAIFNHDGYCIANSVINTKKENNTCELCPKELLHNVEALIVSLTAKYSKIDAICIGSCGPCLLVCDKNLIPLQNAILWSDDREPCWDGLGIKLHQSNLISRLLWIKQNENETYQNAGYVFQLLDFINSVFTGIPSFSIPSDSFSAISTDDFCKAGLNPKLIPPFYKMGTTIGKMTKDYASKLGFSLTPDVLSATGGADLVEVLIGTDTLYENTVCNKTGTTDGIEAVFSKNINDRRFFTAPHPVLKDMWHTGAMMSSTGKSIEWFANNFADGDINALTESLPADAKYDGLIFLPYLLGERAPIWDTNARGVFFGLRASHTKSDCFKAVLESIGYAILNNLEIFRQYGLKDDVMYITGGPSQNDRLNQIKSDITGLKVQAKSQINSELLGLAIIALASLDVFKSIKDGAKSLVKYDKIYYPDDKRHSSYQKGFCIYKDIYLSLKDTFKKAYALNADCI